MIITRFRSPDLGSFVYFCMLLQMQVRFRCGLGNFQGGDVAASSFFMQAFLLLGFYPERDCVMAFSFF